MPGKGSQGGGGENGRQLTEKEKRERSDNESEGETLGKNVRKKWRPGDEGGFKFVVKFKDRSDKGINPLKLTEDF